VDQHIAELAGHYAQLIIQKKLIRSRTQEPEVAPSPESETIDLNSPVDSRSRTLEAEYVGLATFQKLGLVALLAEFGFNQKQIDLAILCIVGRLVRPSSEHRTRFWA